jgi:ubiquinone/menaquinone biosynthesis C-methylase UbiE
MKRDSLQYLKLNGVTPQPSDLTAFSQDGDDVVDGVLRLNGAWYRIEDGILDALPDTLASPATRARFAARHGLEPLPARTARTAEDDVRKAEQIEFFRDDSVTYDRDVSNRSFYVASDRISFDDWASLLRPGGLVCDIGAGSGRVTLPLAQRGLSVVSTDISEEMLRIARQRALAMDGGSRVTYLLADAERLPLRDSLFDAAVCYGVLHHVPNPAAVVAEAGRILRPGGRWLSYDPHRSKVRFLFDWAMKAATLYQELASGNPMIARDEAAAWCRSAGLTADIKLHFFLPPHLLNLFSADTAERWLRVSDRVFNRVGLGSFAGVIVVSGNK